MLHLLVGPGRVAGGRPPGRVQRGQAGAPPLAAHQLLGQARQRHPQQCSAVRI